MLGDNAQDLAVQLRDLGIKASVSAQNLDLPSAWVTPGRIVYDYLDVDTYSMEFDVYLIARDNGPLESLNSLSSMLEKIRVPMGVTEALPIAVNLPNQSADPLPALLITLQTVITKD